MDPVARTDGGGLKSRVWPRFLKDVLVCSLGAFGGPEAHFAVFSQHLVHKQAWLSDSELLELIALTGILPGPSSTQTMVAIGYKVGRLPLALLTMAVWALPALCFMSLLSFLGPVLDSIHVSLEKLRYIGPMAVGFVLVAALRMGRKVVSDHLTLFLLLAGGLVTWNFRQPWVFPLVLAIGAMASLKTSRETGIWNGVRLDPPWPFLAAFVLLALGSLGLSLVWDNPILRLFEQFYRYGYLVIGGGQVVVPLMYSEMVEIHGYLSGQDFLTGFGLVQGLPGPMFSFAAYAGGMAARSGPAWFQVLASMVSGIGIFLPGLLLIFFVYPVWERLRQVKGIQIALKGLAAVAGGLVFSAGITLIQRTGSGLDQILVLVLTSGLLWSRKLPPPLIVAMAVAAGFLVPV